MRSVEGRNKVDEGTLALGDCEANLAHEGKERDGEKLLGFGRDKKLRLHFSATTAIATAHVYRAKADL